MPKEPPLMTLVGGENVQFVEVAFHHLPADLRIVRVFHRTMYVEYRTSLAINGCHDFTASNV